MRRSCLLLLSLPLFTLVGCESIQRVFRSTHQDFYASGKLEKEGRLSGGDQIGEWSYYYETGPLRAQGAFKKDIQTGRWTYWYRNGNKEMEGDFTRERRNDLWRYYHRNGNPRAVGRFDRGRETGQWIFWNGQGERVQRGDFELGKQALFWTYWHAGGSKKAEGYHYLGERVGLWHFWDKEGVKSTKSYPFPENVALVQENWESGSLRRRGFTLDGKPNGRWVSYHQGGGRRIAGDIREGVPEGMWLAFDPDGELLAAGSVEAGEITGDWAVWVNGEERPYQAEGVRPSVPRGGEWTEDGITRTDPPEAVVDLWLSEVQSPVETDTVVAAAPESKGPSPAAWLEQEVSQKQKVPIRAQPWTVREQKNIDNYLRDYGTNPPARSRSAGRYGGGAKRGGKSKGNLEKSEPLIGRTLPKKQFRSVDGDLVDIDNLKGQRKCLLLILRGFAGQVCVYCTTQTRALAPSFQTFEDLDTEVLVVYPGPEAGLDAFLEAYTKTFSDEAPPYTLLYDPDLELAKQLGLVGDLAIPTALVLDEAGVIQYSYVGQHIADRPPAKILIEEIKKIDGE